MMIEIVKKKNLFFLTFSVCVITHFKVLIGVIKNADCWQYPNVYQSSNWEISIGRWLIPATDLIKGQLNLPYVTALISFVFISLSVVVLSDILNASRLENIIIILSLVIAPYITMILTYTYCTDAYSIAQFLSIMSAGLILKARKIMCKEFLVGSAFLVLSLALYQVYLSAFLLLMVWEAVEQAMHSDVWDDVVFHIKKATACLLCSVGAYVAVFKLLLIIKGIGMNQAYSIYADGGSSLLRALPVRIVYSYECFYVFFVKDNIVRHFADQGKIEFIIIVCSFGAIIIFAFSKIRKKWINALFIILSACVFPIIAALNCIISPGNNMTARLSMPLSLTSLLLCLTLIRLIKKSNIKFNVGLQSIIIIGTIYIAWINFLSINATYEYMREISNQERTISRIIIDDLIHEKDEYTYGDDICIVGSVGIWNYGTPSSIYDKCFFMESVMYLGEYAYDATANDWRTFISEELGLPINIIAYGKFEEIYHSDEFSLMECFPNDGYIKKINDITVVKLSEEQ